MMKLHFALVMWSMWTFRSMRFKVHQVSTWCEHNWFTRWPMGYYTLWHLCCQASNRLLQVHIHWTHSIIQEYPLAAMPSMAVLLNENTALVTAFSSWSGAVIMRLYQNCNTKLPTSTLHGMLKMLPLVSDIVLTPSKQTDSCSHAVAVLWTYEPLSRRRKISLHSSTYGLVQYTLFFKYPHWLKIPVTKINSGYWITWMQRKHKCGFTRPQFQ